MGITARGAWESVKRHFRELGVDTQSTDFTVVGVGDMSGDVFGNGMLLSRHIRLVAAFDHRHVFIDPSPDAAASLRRARAPVQAAALVVGRLRHAADLGRRRRVVARARSRSRCRRRPRQALGIDAGGEFRLTPTELLSAILKAPVDLLYNGGIGTYVKSVGRERMPMSATAPTTRSRIDGAALRCKVRGRRRQPGLHAARAHRGGARRCAAVTPTRSTTRPASTPPTTRSTSRSCSGWSIADGEMTDKQRNTLLPKMTDDVAALVLARQLLPDAGAVGVTPPGAPACWTARHASCATWKSSAGWTAPSSTCPPTRKSPSASCARQGLSTPEFVGAARLQQDVAVRRAAGLRSARGPVGRDGAAGLLPAAAAREVRRAGFRATR